MADPPHRMGGGTAVPRCCPGGCHDVTLMPVRPMPVNPDEPAAVSVEVALTHYIERDPQRLGGVAVFRGTRVPVKSLFDHLQAGDALETFLDDFPGVTHEQAQGVIDLAGRRVIAAARLR